VAAASTQRGARRAISYAGRAAGRPGWSSSAAGSMMCCGRGCKGWTAGRSRRMHGVLGQVVPGSSSRSGGKSDCRVQAGFRKAVGFMFGVGDGEFEQGALTYHLCGGLFG
jgi:hypothetical protein